MSIEGVSLELPLEIEPPLYYSNLFKDVEKLYTKLQTINLRFELEIPVAFDRE